MSNTLGKHRCLILSCSQSKNTLLQPLPAIQRYSGPSYQVLNRFLREQSQEASNLDIYILSAQYGLIRSNTPISYYDQKMNPTNAIALQQHVSHIFQQEILPAKYAEIFVSMGKTYLLAINSLPVMNEYTKLIISRGSAGKKLTELRNWLWGYMQTAPQDETSLVPPNLDKTKAVLRGRTVALNTAEVINQLAATIQVDCGTAHVIRSWYVKVNEERLSPKWAAQVLFSVPVSEFSADEARRVLRKLGLNCYRV